MSVKKDIIRASDGRQVKAGDKITVHCTGSLTNPPKKFWRSAFSRIFSPWCSVFCSYSAQKIRGRNLSLSKQEWVR